MPRRTRVLALVCALILTSPAWAQAQTDGETRPATTTFLGDTGLWFVPTGEVLGHRKWSVSGYRANWDVAQGFTDISHFLVTGAFGIRNRVEVFANVRFDTRIDRDLQPLFIPSNTRYGGVDNSYPYVREGWIGDEFGDTFLGGKFNLLSESREEPVALGVRAFVKLPTADEDDGAGTGKADFGFDAIVSREVAGVAELSGSAGAIFRGDPDDFELSDGFTWGAGAAFPTRSNLRLTAEIFGEKFFEDTVVAKFPLRATDGSFSPLSSELPAFATLAFGATWQMTNGFFAGAGIDWSAKSGGRNQVPGLSDSDDKTGDKFGWQFRIGYHPGVALAPVPVAAAPPPSVPPPPAAPPEHILSVKAQCDPCEVQVGQTSTVTAFPQSSIGCIVTYQWTAPSGSFANATQQKTVWTAPNQVGTVPVTVTVTCPTDKRTAAANVQISVIAAPVRVFTFEDVYFDFDRFSLTEAAMRVLGEAVTTLRANPNLRIRIEGNTCNIGTAEYNLALGERRAQSVRQYLVSNGIAADRLMTISYGEEMPKFDNAREETRRLNRRAALTVQIVQ